MEIGGDFVKHLPQKPLNVTKKKSKKMVNEFDIFLN